MRLKIVPLVGDTTIKRLQYIARAILLNLVHFLVNIKRGRHRPTPPSEIVCWTIIKCDIVNIRTHVGKHNPNGQGMVLREHFGARS